MVSGALPVARRAPVLHGRVGFALLCGSDDISAKRSGASCTFDFEERYDDAPVPVLARGSLAHWRGVIFLSS